MILFRLSVHLLVSEENGNIDIFPTRKQLARWLLILFTFQIYLFGDFPSQSAVAVAIANNPQSDKLFCFWILTHFKIIFELPVISIHAICLYSFSSQPAGKWLYKESYTINSLVSVHSILLKVTQCELLTLIIWTNLALGVPMLLQLSGSNTQAAWKPSINRFELIC